MNVLRLGFENFRNLCPGEIFPGETINVIHGSNAQGKTNLLEAIWLFTGGHSFRGTKDSELPVLKDGKNAPAASLSMTLFTEGREQELRLGLRDGAPVPSTAWRKRPARRLWASSAPSFFRRSIFCSSKKALRAAARF